MTIDKCGVTSDADHADLPWNLYSGSAELVAHRHRGADQRRRLHRIHPSVENRPDLFGQAIQIFGFMDYQRQFGGYVRSAAFANEATISATPTTMSATWRWPSASSSSTAARRPMSLR